MKVIIPQASYKRIMDYAAACSAEITGFFEVEFDRTTKNFTVGRVYELLEQEVTGGDCEISAEAIETFMLELMDQGAMQMPRGWWHSHCNMAVFFSGTDRQAMEDLTNESWNVSIVVNKKQELKCDVNLYEPMRHTFNDVTVEIDVQDEIPQEVIDEVAAKVTYPKPFVSTYVYPFAKGEQGKILLPEKSQVVRADDLNSQSLSKEFIKAQAHYRACIKTTANCKKCRKYWNKLQAMNAPRSRESDFIIPETVEHDPKTCLIPMFDCEDCIEVQHELYGQGGEDDGRN